MKKKIVAVLLACALAAGTAASPAGIVTVRAEEAQEQVTEDGLVYEEKDEGIIITGYTGSGGEVVIPDSIQGKKVISIGEFAFDGCSGLTSVSIPEGVTSIEWSAFGECSGLASVVIPESVTSIGDYAFVGCTSLTGIEIPSGVTSIGSGAFSGCGGLTGINVAEGNMDYASEEGVLYDKAKTALVCWPGGKADSVIVPSGVTSIESRAFSGCASLTSVELPSGVTSIGDGAFAGCSGLTSVSIPEGVTSIEWDTFWGCSGLASVNIPSGVTSIEQNAFDGCSSLTSINVAEGNENYASEDGALYDKEKTNLICCPEGKEGFMIFPEGVTSIEDYAFSGCSGLTSISIPEGVTYIGWDTLRGCSGLTSVNIPEGETYIENGAFVSCSGLKSINVAEGNENYMSEDGVLYNKGKTRLICCPAGKEEIIVVPAGVTSIWERAFENCSGLTSISIPEGVTSIGWFAFQGCSSLTSMSLPAGVTSIGRFAFRGCSSLTSMSLPAGVTSIGDRAFEGCSVLKDVYYAGSREQWERIISIMGNDGLESATIHYGLSSSGNGGSGGSSGSGSGGSSNTGAETVKKSAQSVTANDITTTYGVKAFSLGAKSSGGTTLSYVVSNPKVATVDATGKVTVKGCGITDITITAAETSAYAKAQKVIKLTVKPKKMTIASVKSTKKKTATVKWKKDKAASGYLVECATDNKFKKNKVKVTVGKNKTTTTTVKKLKAGKKYYIRICAYAKAGNAKVQGDWSKAKTVKVKK